MHKNDLWVEKYRPSKLEDVILPVRIANQFKNGLESNLLLSGTQGTGKTTLAKILAKGHSTKFINASMNNGIDTIRNDIQDFVSTTSLLHHGSKKVVIFDEADNISEAGQKSLRGLIEQFHTNALFIFTANFPEKIIDPIRSRVSEVVFNFSDEEERDQMRQYIKRINLILNVNNYKIEKDALSYLLKTRYPDLRKMLGDLQIICSSLVDTDTIKLENVTRVNISKHEDLYNFLCTESASEKIYSYIKSNYMNKESEAMKALASDFLKYLVLNSKVSKVIPIATVVHKYNYEMPSSIDKFVTLLACCGSIAEILKK